MSDERRGPGVWREGEDSGYARRLAWVLGMVWGVRVIYAFTNPLDLAPDESYYWDWGRRLDLGYYSKPPMIGWLMGLASALGGNSLGVLRLVPASLATLAPVFLFALGRAMFGARAGFWAAMILLATPGNAALATFFTIDAPLFFFWSGGLWAAWRWWTARAGGGRWGAILAVFLGLGYLTKQICLVFPLCLAVFVGLARERPRRGLAWEWAGIVVGSLVFLIPPVVWNARHDWITLAHTVQEVEHRQWVWSRSVKFVGEFLGGQAGLSGGLSWLAMMAALGMMMRRWAGGDPRWRFLVLFSAPGLMAFLGLSLFQRVEQNWALSFYPALGVALAGWAFGEGNRQGAMARAVPVGVALGGVLGMALMAVPWVVPATRWAGSRGDPTARVRGWRQLAEQVEVIRHQVPRPDQTVLVSPEDRYVASALAFYLPDRPRTYCWEDPARPESQYGIWGPPWEREGWDALIVTRRGGELEERGVNRAFVGMERWGEIEVRLGPGDRGGRRYEVYLGRGLTKRGKDGGGDAGGAGGLSN